MESEVEEDDYQDTLKESFLPSQTDPRQTMRGQLK